jgi:DNA-binding response OmpR family regulator
LDFTVGNSMTRRKKKRILIIDNDTLVAKAYSDHLERDGYDVQIADDGEKGLKKVKSFKPNLVMLEISLPKLNGIKVLKSLRNDPKNKLLPIIIATNVDDASTRMEAMQSGVTVFIVKFHRTLDQISDLVEQYTEYAN